MASQKSMLEYVLFQLSSVHDIGHRAMMGEYILYCQGKVVGGIYDDRLLVKITPSSQAILPNAQQISPYPGAKNMLWIEDIEDRELLKKLFESMVSELPFPKPRPHRARGEKVFRVY